MSRICRQMRLALAAMLMVAGVTVAGGPALAQGAQTVDPDLAIDGDLATPPANSASAPDNVLPQQPREPALDLPPDPQAQPSVDVGTVAAQDGDVVVEGEADNTYRVKHLVAEAEGVFGKGSEGLARIIEDILRDQGEPNGYIIGGEGGGAFVLGLRYGKGTLYHKIEGQKPVYWTGPSVGLDVGGNAGKTFVLVYNLFDTEDLFDRFPAGEGQAYLVGGFHASYLRKGDIVLIPIRMGAGLRLGVNAGYMKFSKKRRILPF